MKQLSIWVSRQRKIHPHRVPAIIIKQFGISHAENQMRKREWAEAATELNPRSIRD
jgi:hypothetical protein